MSLFSPRTFPEILGEMITKLTGSTPLSDVNYGSVFTTMLEAAAQEDDEQYFQMLEIIRGYSLDTTTGSDLDDRAFEYGLTRLKAQKASTTVTLGDAAIVKVSTGVYSGLPGAPAGNMTINADVSTGFPASGSIIVGRGTPNVETIPYTSITNNTNYVTFNLGSVLQFDHGTDETITLSQGGARTFSGGLVVSVPASDINTKIDFTLDAAATILDGESEVDLVPVTASVAGSSSNVPVGAISQFASAPFSTATVRNTQRVTNGSDDEQDPALRDRIKSTIQSLSRGTGKAIITSVIGVTSASENKRVVSASLVEPTTPADVVKLYVDDGTGFIPGFSHVGYEEIITSATGGEKFLSIKNTPLMKAFVEAQNAETYNLIGGETLVIETGGQAETVTFASTDFALSGAATAQEIVKKINATAALSEARVSSGGVKVRVFSRSNQSEQIRVTGGTANAILSFPTDMKYTAKLYLARNNTLALLSKDGTTASIEAGNAAGYNMNSLRNLVVVVDGKANQPQNIWFRSSDFVSPTSVTASQIRDLLNARVSGINAVVSSNNTKFRIQSNQANSSGSKVRVVETFSKALTEMTVGSFADVTAALPTNVTNVQLFTANSANLYLGHASVQFGTISVTHAIYGSSPIGLVAQYWNGTAWTNLGVNDGTAGFTQDGFITFLAPSDWTMNSVNGSAPMYFVRLQRTQAVLATPPTESRIKICSANEVFGFSETEVVGTNLDYRINRFSGQIELQSPLLAKDLISLGSFDTRAFVATTSSSPFSLVGGEVLSVKVDGVLQTLTFTAPAIPGAATPAEVVAQINAGLSGVTASVTADGTHVKLQTNRWNGGSLEAVSGGANTALNFPLGVNQSFISHVPAIESAAPGGGAFSFPVSQTLIVVMDGNLANNFTIPTFSSRSVTAGISTTVLADSTLSGTFPNNNDISNFDIEITSGPLLGVRTQISSYVAASGQITVNSAYASIPGVGVTFQVIPRTPAQVVKFWNNKKVTLISNSAEVRTCAAGTAVQIASLTAGETASVLISGGTANAQFTFPTQAVLGVDGYRNFSGLAQQAQWTVDGKSNDPNYPGIRAAGVQVEVAEPITVPISIQLSVVTSQGTSIGSITNDLRSAVSGYINALPVGEDVILSEIIVAAKAVAGTFDVKIVSPTANIAIADQELARINESSIVIG